MKSENMARKELSPEEEQKERKTSLKWYLNQYFRAAAKREQLELRIQAIREVMGSVQGIRYDLAPGGRTNNIGDGAASEILRIAEIEERIEEQNVETNQALMNVLEIMDFLPAESMERTILEYRHIDRLTWRKICGATNYSRSRAADYYNKGIEKLLTFQEVRERIEKVSAQNNS